MKVSCFVIGLTLAVCGVAGSQEDLVPFVFEMKGGEKAVFGLADPDDVKRGISVDVIVDEPWNRSAQKVKLYREKIESVSEESEVSRKGRIDRAWEDSGNGVEIETETGKKWVFKTDLTLAQRALDAGRAREVAAAEIPVEAVETIDATPVGGDVSRGGILQWWRHGLIVLGTGFFGFLIVWWGFIRRSWSTL